MTHLIRLDHTIPWRTSWRHRWLQQPGRKLHLLALHMNGVPLSGRELRRLTAWLAWMKEQNLVVDYDRDHGFTLVPRQSGDATDGVPIRRPGPPQGPDQTELITGT